MLSVRSSFDEPWAVPAILFTTTILNCLTTPYQHALQTHAVSWLSLCAVCSFRASQPLRRVRPGKRVAYTAGMLLGITNVCERAVDGHNLWWTNALLPLALFTTTSIGTGSGEHNNEQEQGVQYTGSWLTTILLTLCALVASYQPVGSNALTALGLTYLVLSVVTLRAVEQALKLAGAQDGTIIHSTRDLLKQPQEAPDVTVVLRDIAAVAGVVCLFTAVFWESWTFNGLKQWSWIGKVLNDFWIPGQFILSLLQGTVSIVVQFVFSTMLILTVDRKTLRTTSYVLLAGFVSASVVLSFTINRLWFFCIVAAMLPTVYDEVDVSKTLSRVRPGTVSILCATTSLVIWALAQTLPAFRNHTAITYQPQYGQVVGAAAPLQPLDTSVHPVTQLTRNAEAEWSQVLARQSQTLEVAVREYRQRYGMNPPPNFDRWYEFARARNVQLIDEYDTIQHSLLPFWALSPAVIRARVRESLGNRENNLLALLVRDGKVVHVENADDWQQRATVGMLENYVAMLPDMDLAFNIHDEPRVVLPFDSLHQMVQLGKAAVQSTSADSKNAFSSRPNDVNSGRRVEEVKTSPFNTFAHQKTYGDARLSCPLDSPARSLAPVDNLTAYSFGDLGFIYNQTAFSDICNTPSFETSHGFFEQANAFSVVHELYPIFSQSKISSFQDIVYPSVWYWYGRTAYDARKGKLWTEKEDKLYWRGGTTGGFSRDGGWRRQHRQSIVRKINALDTAEILQQGWSKTEVPRQEYADLMDVHFSVIKQCDAGDCAAQQEFFTVVSGDSQDTAWQYKYLLDMDGNAYSGRFYAFLRSHSLTLKMSVFREWHEYWIKPWVHYIPLSLKGDEILETVRHIYADEEGQEIAQRIAQASTEWADKALRNDDFEVYLFRLLLEYGRVIDDNRAEIGFR